MAAAGTLLSDLDPSTAPSSDGDLVQKILSDMNIPTDHGRGPQNIPPPMPMQNPPSYTQSQPSMQPITMDSNIPMAHMIGTEHPTPADFSAAMASVHENGPMGIPQHPYAPTPPIPGALHYQPPSKNIYSTIISEIKIPFIVALLFFIFSLSPVRVLVNHYMPNFIKATGEFHLTGLLFISMVVGLTFWVLYRIIAPLLSF